MPALAERDHEALEQLLVGAEAQLAVRRARRRRAELGRRVLGGVEIGRAQAVPGAHRPGQLGDVALVQDPAAVDDRDPVAQLLDVGHLVAREEHRDPLRREAADERLHVAHPGRVEAGLGLVEDEQPRAAQERGGDAEPLAHPVGVAADPVARPVGQVDGVEHLVDPRAGVAAVEGREQLQVLAPGQVRVELRRLDEPGDPLERAPAHADRIAAEQPGAARGRPDQAEQHAQRRRLAGAVRAQVAVDVAGSTVRSTSSTAARSPYRFTRPRASTGRSGGIPPHQPRCARGRLGRRRRQRSDERVAHAAAVELDHRAERGRQLVAGRAVDRDARQRSPAARRRGVGRPARGRRSRRGPGRRRPSRPGVPDPSIRRTACRGRPTSDGGAARRNGTARATAAVPATSAYGPPTPSCAGACGGCTWTIFVPGARRTVRSEDGTVPKLMSVTESATTGVESPWLRTATRSGTAWLASKASSTAPSRPPSCFGETRTV